MKKILLRLLCLSMAFTIALTACEGPEGDPGATGADGAKGDKGDKGDTGEEGEGANQVVLANHSTTTTFIKKLTGFESVEVYSLLGSADYFPESPNYTFGGAADGTGVLKTADGFVMMVNNEDNIAVSRITFDKTFRPIKGEYYLNSNGGDKRLCSASLATPEEHGFGPLFLTCSENASSYIHGLDPLATTITPDQKRFLPGLGHWAAENAVPLPKTAYAGKTVIVIGDDDSAAGGGQVGLYVSSIVGDLENGNLYVMRTLDKNISEKAITATEIPVEFVQIQNQKNLSTGDMEAAVAETKAIQFGRVEDIDYRKDGVGRELYFNVTGQEGNADRTKNGRVYKLVLDPTDPTKGTLSVILDGDDAAGPANMFMDPDNIMVTENYAYITEDPNGYAPVTAAIHDAYLYQYNLKTKALKKVFELDHFRGNADAEAVYGVAARGGWEYGAMVDVSDIIGIPNTFTLNIQVHSWKSDAFKGVDGGTLATNFNEGSQIVVVSGLPR